MFSGLGLWMFLKEVSYAHQSCIYLIKQNSKTNIVKYIKTEKLF